MQITCCPLYVIWHLFLIKTMSNLDVQGMINFLTYGSFIYISCNKYCFLCRSKCIFLWLVINLGGRNPAEFFIVSHAEVERKKQWLPAVYKRLSAILIDTFLLSVSHVRHYTNPSKLSVYTYYQ